jgi:1,2-diacylglycerol-3-alpha-glucose alpha-1,2-glucosyltransferase
MKSITKSEMSVRDPVMSASNTISQSDKYCVCHPMRWESYVDGGVTVSARQQRVALDHTDTPYTPDPTGDYDILHLNFPGPRAVANFARAKRHGRPVVIHAHSIGENIADTYRLSRVLAPAIRRYFSTMYAKADAVIAVSPYMRDRLHANGVTENVVVVSNGVDGEALDGYESVDAPCYRDGPTVVNLAQVYGIKGVDDFIGVGERLPNTQFVWYGPKHRYLTPRRITQITENSPSNVLFPGFVEDKREAFAAGDIFLFPTHRDNQPLAILEAAYCGLPIVTRNIPAFEGWLTHGDNCLKGSSVTEFCDYVEQLRDDPALREQLGRNAQHMAADHDLGTIGQQLRAVYESVLKTGTVTADHT